MEETKDANRAGGHEEETTPRQEEATSGETLGDLERTQADTASKPAGGASGAGGSSETSTPSPDGAFDSARGGRADGSDAGEPM